MAESLVPSSQLSSELADAAARRGMALDEAPLAALVAAVAAMRERGMPPDEAMASALDGWVRLVGYARTKVAAMPEAAVLGEADMAAVATATALALQREEESILEVRA